MGPVMGMSDAILVDTDVLIDFLRGSGQAVAFVEKYTPQIVLSPIVVAELYAGVKGSQELAVLGNFVALFRVVPVTSEIAKIGGLYRRDFGKSHGVGLADAILAATAVKEDAQLKTLTVKHYPMFKGLKPAYRK